MLKLFIFYLLLINALGLLLMIADKSLARKRMRRIAEINFFMVAFLGGCAGIIFAMVVVRHKTRHKTFTIGLPLILALQILLFLFLILF